MPPRRKSKPGPARQSRSRASNTAEPPVDHEQPTEFPLAQELTDLIVDHVYDDLNTLKSCSLVNRSFHMSSRRHQFSRIELTGIEPPSPPTRQWRRLTKNLCEKFHALIVESPEIALLVKDIRIVEGRQYSSVPWLSNEPLLPVVLCSLVNLQGISLAGNSCDVVWPKLPARLRETFLAIFQSPKLKRVAISHVDSLPHPYDLFSKFKASNLRGISLSSVTNFQSLLRSQILSTSPTPSFPLPIDSLEFSLEHPGLLALTRALEQISVNLRLLSVDCQNEYDISDVQPAFDLIRRLCGGLQDLKIKVNGKILPALLDLRLTLLFQGQDITPHRLLVGVASTSANIFLSAPSTSMWVSYFLWGLQIFSERSLRPRLLVKSFSKRIFTPSVRRPPNLSKQRNGYQ